MTGWYDDGNGEDTLGFSALPAGQRIDNGSYYHEGYYAYFWSSTEGGSDSACDMHLNYYDDGAYLSSTHKDLGFSVRCLKD